MRWPGQPAEVRTAGVVRGHVLGTLEPLDLEEQLQRLVALPRDHDAKDRASHLVRQLDKLEARLHPKTTRSLVEDPDTLPIHSCALVLSARSLGTLRGPSDPEDSPACR